MSESLVSVIVPCYKQGQYLPESLQSVLEQTYQNWECIIVDDGSPDNTESIALGWCKMDNRFIYLKKENGGLSSARNAGIEIATGSFILPLDADDKIAPKYLENAVKVFQKEPDTDLVYCKAYYFGEDQGLWNLPNYSFAELLVQNMIFCSALMKREKVVEVGLYDKELKTGLEDWEFYLRYLSPSSRVIQLNEILFYYRIRLNSMARTLNKSNDSLILLRRRIIEKNRRLYDHLVIDFITVELERRSLIEQNAKLKEKLESIEKYKKTSILWLLRPLYKIFINSLRFSKN